MMYLSIVSIIILTLLRILFNTQDTVLLKNNNLRRYEIDEAGIDIAEDTFFLENQIQKILQALESLNNTDSNARKKKADLLNEKSQIDEKIFRLNQVGMDYMQRSIDARKFIDKSLLLPTPFFAHPDGYEINGIVTVTRETFDAWSEKIIVNEHKNQCGEGVTIVPEFFGETCEWCPFKSEHLKHHRFSQYINAAESSEIGCIKGSFTFLGALEEKGFYLRKAQSYMAVQRQYMNPKGIDNMPYSMRTAVMQCKLQNLLPRNIPGVVTFRVHSKFKPIHGEVIRSQEYDTDKIAHSIQKIRASKYGSIRTFNEFLNPQDAASKKFLPKISSQILNEIKKDSTPYDVNYFRYFIENEATNKRAYDKDSIVMENVVCSRGLFGNVDGSLIAKFAEYYIHQGFDKVIFYDLGAAQISHPELIAKQIDKGNILWIDLREWYHRNYGFLAIDMLLFSKSMGQMLAKYDCLYRTKYHGTKWILNVDPDELLFQGSLGWSSDWENNKGNPKNNSPNRESGIKIVDAIKNIPEKYAWISFGSLLAPTDSTFCKSPVLWSSWEDIVKTIDEKHINIEAKSPNDHFQWHKTRCESLDSCVGGSGMRKILIRPSRVTIPTLLRLHDAECSGFTPWNEDDPEEGGFHMNVKVAYIRHVRCLNHFGKVNQWSSKGTWFMDEVHRGARGGL